MVETSPQQPVSVGQAAGDALLRRHRRVGAWAASGAVAMLLLAFASVPLYRMFCQVTGYSGTPQTAARPSDLVLDRTVEVRFDATVSPGLARTVVPVEQRKTVRMARPRSHYRATNISGRPWSASFSVSPDQTGAYFNKLQCFCFSEQRLEPGQTMDMAVSFFVSWTWSKTGCEPHRTDHAVLYVLSSREAARECGRNGTAGPGDRDGSSGVDVTAGELCPSSREKIRRTEDHSR
jgi:cytochrome c oxidase assembly protein subunit 11